MLKRGQVTLFIILAIVIVGSVVVYYFLARPTVNHVPEDFRPVYDYYISCLKDSAAQGIELMNSQGGRIEKPVFSPGSAYMPFSSELDFLGQGVPYWLYVSGSNVLKEQVPTKVGMQNDLNRFLGERLTTCDFSMFERQGYSVYVKEGSARAKINDLDVSFDVQNEIDIYYMNESVSVKNHEFDVKTKLGKYHNLANEIYNYEKENTFLESYALDVMRTYAPVTGVDISCIPKIFIDEQIRRNITEGLALNIPTLKLKGDYYQLSSKERGYFVEKMDFNVDENVNFMYLPTFPTKVEIYGDRVVKPVGLQEGMGVLGFCYVPYQLIYDIDFPVMVQIYDDNEMFQFPISVIISKNNARRALEAINQSAIMDLECQYKNQEVRVSTYDLDLNPVNAIIQYKCMNSICDIGETATENGEAVLDGDFPQCVNGFILADADGYSSAKIQLSTNEEDAVNIVMRKKYNLNLNPGDVEKAVVSFTSDDYSTTVLYPDTKAVDLVEGYYNVSVYVYGDSPVKIPAVNERKCVDVPESGLAGIFGSETEKCFDINIPEMDAEFAVVGGGVTQEYFTETQLRESGEIDLNVPLFKIPTTMEEMQNNQIAAMEERVYVTFA